ncbi:succinylglutamate desuccinylase/aspartoacylase family protein [Shewanella dokdonensis]|uniref:Succinylglutamate desuccinylase/aspartoacylase family protein n=1 Tax=Shewanella dokdonensis TaxID=712036 RepID=A0ABX8DCH6_9GAMM|nr:succinylglutamate desuccinylase/aspartoacylase family protein [Shewanella dokdonensis]MCL1074635.1 M14 family metallopeptidase [Shewanella dokdonensis]QVK22366.1 succinylglutamate desuccinylase/aspartoacylase family protein [Shewanella dokdonensis]
MQPQLLAVGELAAGQTLTVPVYQFIGSDPAAPSVYIQANVHGAEVQGNAVILQLLRYLRQHPPKGDVTLVPLANPLGINQKSGEFTLGRFDPVTGENWNRQYLDNQLPLPQWLSERQHYPDAELIATYRQALKANLQTRLQSPWGVTTGQRLAYTLQLLATEADIVLDLHTGPKSCRHLYCPEYQRHAIAEFSIPFTLLIPNLFGGAMDEAIFCPWWRLSDYLASQGRQLEVPVAAFTLELGDQELLDMTQAQQDAQGILAFLSQRGIVAESLAPAVMPRYATKLSNYRKFHAPQAGLVQYLVAPGSQVKQGEPLVRLLRLDLSEDAQEQLLTAPESGIAILHFASAAVQQGTELYKIMTRATKI